MKKALFGLVAAGWLLTLAASGSQAGAKNGSNRWSVRVPANGTATYNIRFVGGQLAEMAIIGDGTTDVDIVVFDAQGQVEMRAGTWICPTARLFHRGRNHRC